MPEAVGESFDPVVHLISVEVCDVISQVVSSTYIVAVEVPYRPFPVMVNVCPPVLYPLVALIDSIFGRTLTYQHSSPA